MMNDEVAIKILRENFCGPISSIYSNYGSLVKIDYKEPAIEMPAETGIFIYLSNWVMCQGSQVLLTDQFRSRTKANAILQYILHTGEEIIDIIYISPHQSFVILLKNNITIMLSHQSGFAPEDDMVNFFLPDKSVLCYSPQREFYWETDLENDI